MDVIFLESAFKEGARKLDGVLIPSVLWHCGCLQPPFDLVTGFLWGVAITSVYHSGAVTHHGLSRMRVKTDLHR